MDGAWDRAVAAEARRCRRLTDAMFKMVRLAPLVGRHGDQVKECREEERRVGQTGGEETGLLRLGWRPGESAGRGWRYNRFGSAKEQHRRTRR